MPSGLINDRYQLGERLGRGGMGEVYRAIDLRLEREVAVKFLDVAMVESATSRERFTREGRAAGRLSHANIVAVYDTGEWPDQASSLMIPYIVMELVNGQTLRDVLHRNGRFEPAEALTIVERVLSALDYSHARGIIHRDIKPANIMVTDFGEIKVMDFGIARLEAADSLTRTASMIGSPQYLSPEQARGEKADQRSDVYGTGCLLYELLTGQTPFQGDSPVALAYQHIERAPTPPSQIAGAVSGEVEAIVLRALAKDPADRYQRAEEMRAEIAQVLAGNPAGSQADVRPSKAVRRLKGSSKLRSERVGSARADDPPTRELDQFNPSPRLIAEPQRPSRATATRPRHVWPITLLAVTALVASGFLGWLVIKDHLTTTEIDPTAPVTTDPTDGPVAEIVLTVGRYSTDLSELNLSQFHLTPTDVEQLRHMTNLTHLHLSETGIVNLSPLSGLTNLTYLYLNGNALSNIDALKGLTNLTHLYLALNAISDISALSELANLKVLNLNVNRVSDLSPLSGLTHLTDLYLSENKISDLSPLESLSNLQAILLKRNPLTDSDITNLQSHLPNCEIHWP